MNTPYQNPMSLDKSQSSLAWTIALNPNAEPHWARRKTSIIATIGPATNSVDMLLKLRKAGMDIVRLNFSHGSHEYHQSIIDNVNCVRALHPDQPLAIALDTKGPEIRTGDTVDGREFPIKAGHVMRITTDDSMKNQCSDSVLYIDYKNLCNVIEVGRKIYVDDGVMSLEVMKRVSDTELIVQSDNAGVISSRKGVNLPGTDVDLPSLSQKDIEDLKFGVENKVDMIFASFIRSADDIHTIRHVLGEAGRQIMIIAKIENQQGLNNFDQILRVTDGVMVARGDLGIEIPVPAVFVAQKMMIAKCNLAGKPVVCATQMLESMTVNPRPTRAEVSDVGNSVLDGADCVMLSGETAKGKYPVLAVENMSNICARAEATVAHTQLFNNIKRLVMKPLQTTEATCSSAINAVIDHDAKAIVVLSTTGNTARLCAKYRPACPILMVTRNQYFANQSLLYRGVQPLVYHRPRVDSNDFEWQKDVDARVEWAINQGKAMGLLRPQDPVVVLQGWKKGSGHTCMLRLLNAE